MSKIKVHLFGKHSNRTPLAYSAYTKLFKRHVEYVEDPCAATILVTGFRVDFIQNKPLVSEIKRKNPGIKLAVISEEPLWDTLWGGDYSKKVQHIANPAQPEQDLEIFTLNHFNSKVFEFQKIPYFITTDDNFFLRYNLLFSRNTNLSTSDLINTWNRAPVRTAFCAAKREGSKYLHQNDQHDVYGLSVFRSEVAAQFSRAEGALHVGQGWAEAQPRQALNDWHLDKLALLDRRSYVISALENTHTHDYISEKIFDAFGCVGLPLYSASPSHRIKDICDPSSFINLYSLSPEESREKILSLQATKSFASDYINNQHHLSLLFKNPRVLIEERESLVTRTLNAIKTTIFC